MKGPSAIRPMINLGNSIVGVSILAMPYCFKEVLVCNIVSMVIIHRSRSCIVLNRALKKKNMSSYNSAVLPQLKLCIFINCHNNYF